METPYLAAGYREEYQTVDMVRSSSAGLKATVLPLPTASQPARYMGSSESNKNVGMGQGNLLCPCPEGKFKQIEKVP